MAIRRFVIEGPEQLRGLAEHVKDLEMRSRLGNYAVVWSTQRRKTGKTPWDGQMAVRFEAQRVGARRAHVVNGEHVIAEMKYRPALAVCREQMQEA